MGMPPACSIVALEGWVATQRTWGRTAAGHVPVTSPTYPVPIIDRFISAFAGRLGGGREPGFYFRRPHGCFRGERAAHAGAGGALVMARGFHELTLLFRDAPQGKFRRQHAG